MPTKKHIIGESALVKLYEQSFEQTPLPLIWQLKNGIIVKINSAAADYFGHSKESLCGTNIMRFCPELTPEALEREWEQILKHNSFALCVRHICAGGVINHAEITKTYIEAGGEEFSVVTVTNVSPLKRKAEEIQFLYEIMDMSNDAILAVKKSEQTVVYANEKACTSLGFTKDEITGMSISVFMLKPENFGEFAPYIDKLRELNKKMVYEVQQRKDGSKIPVEVSIKEFQRDGERYDIAIVRDINERVRHLIDIEQKNGMLRKLNKQLSAEVEERKRELHFTEEKYETYVNSAPDPIFFFDKYGIYKEVNEALCIITGYTKEELLQMNSLSLIAPESLNDAKKSFYRLLKTGKASVSLKFISKNKEHFYLDLNAAEMENGLYMSVCKNITRSVLLEEELKKLNNELSERVREEVMIRQKQEGFLFEQKKLEDMGLLINAIAHQWRQPINALILYIQDILDTYNSGELTEEYIRSFESVCKDLVLYMSKTIDDFRTFFAPNKTKTYFDVRTEIVELMKLLRGQLSDRHISYEIKCICKDGVQNCKDDTPWDNCSVGKAVVYGYQDEFKQALLNIIYNSADAIEAKMEKDEIAKGAIIIEMNNNIDSVFIRIKDNGIGINDETLPKVFDPYYTTKEQGKGTGIGLFMAKMVIEKHNGGKINAYNTASGAMFELVIPK